MIRDLYIRQGKRYVPAGTIPELVSELELRQQLATAEWERGSARALLRSADAALNDVNERIVQSGRERQAAQDAVLMVCSELFPHLISPRTPNCAPGSCQYALWAALYPERARQARKDEDRQLPPGMVQQGLFGEAP